MPTEPDRPIQAVLFDLGGVLIEWDPRPGFVGVLPEQDVEPFLAEIDFHTRNRTIDAGRPLREIEAEVDAQFPHHAGVMAAYARNFPATLTGEVPGTADILRELGAAGVRLVALTNWSGETFHHARELFDFLTEFEAIVVSGDERMIKPDPALFELTMERHDLVAGRTAFIDDSAANVAAASALGLHAIRFENAGQLRQDLRSLGLPLAAP
jgi:2-haloacid dehalogenase